MSDISTQITRDEAAKYLAMSEDELYLKLVPESAVRELHSTEGLIAKGKLIFLEKFKQSREAVCPEYLKHRERYGYTIEGLMSLASILVTIPAMSSVPILPLAALGLKLAIYELCKDYKKNETR